MSNVPNWVGGLRDYVDWDNDGKISVDEADFFLNNVDENGDGRISRSELKQVFDDEIKSFKARIAVYNDKIEQGLTVYGKALARCEEQLNMYEQALNDLNGDFDLDNNILSGARHSISDTQLRVWLYQSDDEV